jgi:hypothetical protein
MLISHYLYYLVGEDRKRVTKLHHSTTTRLKAFAIAMHIPLLIWGITGYLIAGRLFNLDDHDALLIATFCTALIYLVERIVIATPKNGYVNAVRLFIGVIMAVIGASAVDLVIFQREIAQQLKMAGESVIHAEHDAAINTQRALAEKIRMEWTQRQASANCEANGTCGSGLRSLGPIYRQLVQQAEALRQEYREAGLKITLLESAKGQALEDWRASDRATEQAGLLARIQALHDYTLNNAAAAAAWLLFFLLMLSFELTVVLVKLAFGPTVDDHIELVREQLSRHRASTYLDAVTSPTAAARQLMSTAT